MGYMLQGVYHAEEFKPKSDAQGAFQREASAIRGSVAGAMEAGRYHLYLAVNCPWAHRTWLTCALKSVTDQITMSFAKPKRTDQGWIFDADGRYSDPLYGFEALHQLYARHDNYTGRITVPVLVDKNDGRLINNESAEILRIINDGFDGPDFYPEALRDKIDAWNERIYPRLNNGVYRAGFARTQEAYDAAVVEVFEMLDEIEIHLGGSRYLTGDQMTEADIRLFPTLARFDHGYHSAFKCNKRRIVDYPNIWGYASEIYQMAGVAETVDFDVYRRGYNSQSELRNPLGIIPIGPDMDWLAPHGRG